MYVSWHSSSVPNYLIAPWAPRCGLPCLLQSLNSIRFLSTVMPSLPSGMKSDADQITSQDVEVDTKSQALDRIRVKNRRKRYLDLNPGYFGPALELAGVLLCSD